MRAKIWNTKKALVLLVAFSLVHNLEEYIAINYLRFNDNHYENEFITAYQFNISVLVISILILLLSALAIYTSHAKTYRFLSTTLAASFILNSIFPHLTLAIYTFSYTPGLVSCVLLVIPQSIALLTQLRKLYENKKKFWVGVLYGILLGYGIFLGLILLVKAII